MTVTLTEPTAQLEAAKQAAWTGECADWPYAALLLAHRIDQLHAERDALAREAAQADDLRATLDQLRSHLRDLQLTSDLGARMIERGNEIYRGHSRWLRGLIARRTAGYILHGVVWR